MDFYAKLAGAYDEMTRSRERLPGEKSMLQKWVEHFQVRSVLDAACGTGLHAIILVQLGVKVVGADSSAAMIERARENARVSGVTCEFIVAPMQKLTDTVSGPFEAIFCLGNSLPHLLTQPDLAGALGNFYQLLSKNGVVIIQNLNYDRILKQQERIIGVHRAGDREFIRFYDFSAPLVKFNILTIDWSNKQAHSTLEATDLYPYRQQEIEQAMHRSGFTAIEYYGDMRKSQFDPDESINLVVVGKK